MYKSGVFNFPTTTSPLVVTGLGFQPQGVVFIYGNKATVGSQMTGLTGPGLGISICALDYSNPSTILCLGLSINGLSDSNVTCYRGIETGPISMQTDAATASTVDFKASAISFDTDGFTLTIATAAPGVRPVHWFAWGGDIVQPSGNITMQTAAVKQVMPAFPAPNPTFDAGFEAWSALVISTLATNGFGEGSVDGNAWYSFGTGHYPQASAGDAQLWQAGNTYAQVQQSSPLGRQGFTDYFVKSGPGATDWSTVDISDVVSSIGPLLTEGFRRHRPQAEIASQQIFINEGGGAPWQFAAWWNSEGWTDFVTIPAGGSVTVQHPVNFNEFEQVMFSTVNEGGTSGLQGPLRFGFGMLGYDDQGCVVLGPDGTFFQANDRCVAHSTVVGVSAASGVINGGSFTLTSEEDDLGDIQVIYHAWGKTTAKQVWLPQSYRFLRDRERPPIKA